MCSLFAVNELIMSQCHEMRNVQNHRMRNMEISVIRISEKWSGSLRHKVHTVISVICFNFIHWSFRFLCDIVR